MVGDVAGEAGNKSGNRGEVRLRVAGQDDEGDVVAAGGFDATAGYDALAVSEQDDLEQQGEWVGGRASGVVPEPDI